MTSELDETVTDRGAVDRQRAAAHLPAENNMTIKTAALSMHVRCAVPSCSATVVMASSRDIYGDGDPFDPPLPIAGYDSGWSTCAFDYRFCPAHADEVSHADAARGTHHAAMNEAVAKFMAEWLAANPEPAPDWRKWNDYE